MKNPNSFILRIAAILMFFIVNVFSIYLLLRGHNAPGGGFIAGLASAISIILLGLAVGFDQFEKWVHFDPLQIAFYGLAIAVASSLLPLLPFFPVEHHVFFEHHMFHWPVHVGTTLVFDIGVLMVVVGITTKVVYVLSRSTSGRDSLLRGEREFYASPVEEPIEQKANSSTKEEENGS